MSINLGKTSGKSINLSKDEALENILVVLWWKAPEVTPAYDLDLSLFTLGNTPAGPKLIDEEWFIFFNNEASPNGAIVKSPDERSNDGEERIEINLAGIPANAEELSLIVTIHKAAQRRQSFGKVNEAGVKILNKDTNEEIAFFDLDTDYTDETAVQLGSFYKDAAGEFTFQAIGQGYKLTLDDFVAGYVTDDVVVTH